MKRLTAIILALLLTLTLIGCAGESEDAAAAAGTEWTSGPAETFPSETDPSETEPEVASALRYILNKSSRKFHLPDCPSVRQMSDANRKEVVCPRQELLDHGYVPCRKCHP